MGSSPSRTLVLGVTGGIAAYKAAEVVSSLRKHGVCVYVIMTRNAQHFISPVTMQQLSGNPVATEMFVEKQTESIPHIDLGQKGDLFLVAPATANIIAKFAAGIADDLVSTTFLANTAPVLIAPAMNTRMYEHRSVQRNIATLKEWGCEFIEPETGRLACGEVGTGRLASVERITERCLQELSASRDLDGYRVLVTAGGTREPIDPVRYICNAASGKMGHAVAAAAQKRGADVVLVTASTTCPVPQGVQSIHVDTAADMREMVLAEYDKADIIIKAAAVSDFRPRDVSQQKIKKAAGKELVLTLEENPDILAELGEKKKLGQVLIGFAAETENIIANARKKLTDKNLDVVVVNDVTQPGAGFGCDTNIVQILRRDGSVRSLPCMSKLAIADHVLDEALLAIGQSGVQDGS